jgi:hypothetical protein
MITHKETLAQNTLRFFTLMIFEAGVLAGIGSAILLSENTKYLVGVLLVTAIGLCFVTIYKNYNTHHNDPTPIRDLVKTVTALVLIAGLVTGIGVLLIIGTNGAIGMIILLMSIMLMYGLWVFKPGNN